MEKVFDLDGSFFSPSSSVLTGNSFEELSGVFVPAAERFDDERLEEDPLGATVVEVIPAVEGPKEKGEEERRREEETSSSVISSSSSFSHWNALS